MLAHLELKLYKALKLDENPGIRFGIGALNIVDWNPYKTIDDFCKANNVVEKQVYATLIKWSNKEWWEYGVSLATGWFTPEGKEHFDKITL